MDSDMNFRERKEERKRKYWLQTHGWKLRPCTACSGSGIYDNTGSPKCGSCNGTGKEKYRGPDALPEWSTGPIK